MRTVVIIPARYGSSRFKGKPLADICGRPMLWWVVTRVRRAKGVDRVVVATDHEEIAAACRKYHLDYVMTDPGHKTSTERLHEAATRIPADIYVCVNGDEPLIEPRLVEGVIPQSLEGFFAANLMTRIKNPVEAVDNTNIKVVVDGEKNALFMSRCPIPYPKASLDFAYYKHLGVLAYAPAALQFFAATPKGPAERAEDINELRFIEHGKKLRMIPVEADTLSVDTEKDLQYVRKVIAERLQRGEEKL